MELLHAFTRMIEIYFVILITVRLMGKRAAGELTVFDFAIIVGMGDVMMHIALGQDRLTKGLVILATLVILERGIAKLCSKSDWIARVIEGTPTVIIRNGKIIHRNMEKENINMGDLHQELRAHGIDDINKVKEAVLEACGKFSVIEQEEHARSNADIARLAQKIDRLERIVQEKNR